MQVQVNRPNENERCTHVGFIEIICHESWRLLPTGIVPDVNRCFARASNIRYIRPGAVISFYVIL